MTPQSLCELTRIYLFPANLDERILSRSRDGVFAMSGNEKAARITRRDLLSIAAAGGGAMFAAGFAGHASAAPKKFTQQQAKYQPVPKNGQRCQTCALWQAPTSCQVVEGPISPAGWCMLYQAKS